MPIKTSWQGATLGANTFTGTQAITGNMSINGQVGIGGAISANIQLRISGQGLTTAHGIYITDASGNINLDVLDNGSVLLARASPLTTATAGFVYIPVSAGAPTGVPVAQTGYVPIQFDSTTSQFWVYVGGAWKQPKTPAAASIVTWQ